MSAFTAYVYPPIIRPTPDEFIVTREVHEKLEVPEGAKKGEFVKKEVLEETGRVNRKEYVQSFADDCGINALMARFVKFQDPEIFNQVPRNGIEVDADGYEKVIDLTKLPSDNLAGLQMVLKANEVFKSLDPALQKAIVAGDDAAISAWIASNVKQNQNTEGGNE